MAKKSKKPVLRKGLSVKQLIGDHWSQQVVDGREKPWSAYPETEVIAHKIVLDAVQQLINYVDAGNDVGRQEVKCMLHCISANLQNATTVINERISDGTVTPTLLDKIAGV